MGMGRNDVIDILGIDSGRLQVLRETAHLVVALHRFHAGFEQDELVAGIDDERVLIEDEAVGRQEMLGHQPADFVRVAEENLGRIAERNRPVRNHRAFDCADFEAIERRRLSAERGRFGQSGVRTRGEQTGGTRHRRTGKQSPAR